jgi:hypothetical protein
MKFRCLMFISIILLMPVISWAATHTAASASYADVSAAVNSALEGDTVEIPSGQSATWTSTLTISKELTLMSATGTPSVITHNSANATIAVSLSSDVPVRISGLYIDKVSNSTASRPAIYINGKVNNSFAYTKIRIDHCTINKGGSGIYVRGWVYGVIDSNTLINVNRGILLDADADGRDYSWQRPIEAGTDNALFIEDNTFIQNASYETELNEAVYHQWGMRTVIRYNLFDASAYPMPACMFDSHGNQGYYPKGDPGRGQPIIELYHNTWKGKGSYRVCYFRSGSILMHDETFIFSGSVAPIVLSEEEGWQSAFFSPLRTVWPAEDQIFNSFFWNITVNGAAITNVGLSQSSDSTFIQKDRDYFMHAPAATGGKETFPTRAGAANMTFSSSGANAYYPYTPYEYPHPLRTLVGKPEPAAPKNLTIIQQ